MSGTIELDRDGRSLLIRFPYSEFLVQEVREMPGRRWDKGQKVWRVPAEHAEVVVDAFMKHGFSIAPDVFAIVAGTQNVAKKPKKSREAKPAADGQDAAPDAATAPHLTVGQLNDRVRQALLAAFPERVAVVGEVVNYDKNKDRKHLFFSLIEKETGGRRIAASVDVALFERTARRLLPELEKKGLTLRDGIEILIEAKVDLYPATGRFQLIVEDIRPEFTLGQLALSREQILQELRAAGLERRNAELELPVPCLRVGVLTSPDSDGWNDFLREIETSGIGFQVSLYPVRVQGEELRPTMLRGLKWFARRAGEFDVLCVVRGGGSRTDLAWFDDKEVAFAVAKHPLKILCGIGHERDRSVLDEIAYGLKTPTATAAYLADRWLETEAELRERSARLREAAQRAVRGAREDLASHAHTLRRVVHGRLVAERHVLAAAAHRMVRGSASLLRDRGRDLADSARRIRAGVRENLGDRRRTLERAVDLLAARTRRQLDRAAAALATAEARQRLLDPRRVLLRGYAMVRGQDGRIVTDARTLRPGQEATVQLRDGSAHTRVESVELLAEDNTAEKSN